MRAAFFGGVYSNWVALDAALRDARQRGAEALYCLGDLGGFGPHPDRSIERLREHRVATVQGNYDDAVGNAFHRSEASGLWKDGQPERPVRERWFPERREIPAW